MTPGPFWPSILCSITNNNIFCLLSATSHELSVKNSRGTRWIQRLQSNGEAKLWLICFDSWWIIHWLLRLVLFECQWRLAPLSYSAKTCEICCQAIETAYGDCQLLVYGTSENWSVRKRSTVLLDELTVSQKCETWTSVGESSVLSQTTDRRYCFDINRHDRNFCKKNHSSNILRSQN